MSRKKNNTTIHLLPSNALPAEKALSLAVAYGSDILPEDIKNLWNLDKINERFLSFLAWGMHVDFWRDDLNEVYKRELIASSFAWHRKKGTPWAVKKVLSDLGIDANVLEWFDIGTEPHTFAVEAEFDYANSEPFSITESTKALLLEAIDYTKPERSHLAYFSFVPKDDDDPDHRCIHDVCHWSHGYLWTQDWGVKELFNQRLLPRATEGYMYRYFHSSAAFQWSALYDANRFSDGAFPSIEMMTQISIRRIVGFADHGHGHRWHASCSWECGGTWENDCCIQKISATTLTFAMSCGVFGSAEFGECNTSYSGGYEMVMPHMGAYGVDEFSSRASDGAYYRPILDFTAHIEKQFISSNILNEKPEGGIAWAS